MTKYSKLHTITNRDFSNVAAALDFFWISLICTSISLIRAVVEILNASSFIGKPNNRGFLYKQHDYQHNNHNIL